MGGVRHAFSAPLFSRLELLKLDQITGLVDVARSENVIYAKEEW